MDNKLEKFSPVETELIKLKEEYKDLKINGMDDETGYLKMKEASKLFQKVRTRTDSVGKEVREDAKNFAKAVVQKVKDLLGITVPREQEINKEIDEYEKYHARKERQVLLPGRIAQLKEIGIEEYNEDNILEQDEKQWATYYQDKKMAYLESKAEENKQDEKVEEKETIKEEVKKEVMEEVKTQEQKLINAIIEDIEAYMEIAKDKGLKRGLQASINIIRNTAIKSGIKI